MNYGEDGEGGANSGDSETKKELTSEDLIKLDMERAFKRTKIRGRTPIVDYLLVLALQRITDRT